MMISPTESNNEQNSETLSACTSLSISKSLRSPSCNVRNRRGGIIFIWPQRRNFRSYRELIFSTWFLTQLFYWMHLLQLLPTDHGKKNKISELKKLGNISF